MGPPLLDDTLERLDAVFREFMETHQHYSLPNGRCATLKGLLEAFDASGVHELNMVYVDRASPDTRFPAQLSRLHMPEGPWDVLYIGTSILPVLPESPDVKIPPIWWHAGPEWRRVSGGDMPQLIGTAAATDLYDFVSVWRHAHKVHAKFFSEDRSAPSETLFVAFHGEYGDNTNEVFSRLR